MNNKAFEGITMITITSLQARGSTYSVAGMPKDVENLDEESSHLLQHQQDASSQFYLSGSTPTTTTSSSSLKKMVVAILLLAVSFLVISWIYPFPSAPGTSLSFTYLATGRQPLSFFGLTFHSANKGNTVEVTYSPSTIKKATRVVGDELPRLEPKDYHFRKAHANENDNAADAMNLSSVSASHKQGETLKTSVNKDAVLSGAKRMISLADADENSEFNVCSSLYVHGEYLNVQVDPGCISLFNNDMTKQSLSKVITFCGCEMIGPKKYDFVSLQNAGLISKVTRMFDLKFVSVLILRTKLSHSIFCF